MSKSSKTSRVLSLIFGLAVVAACGAYAGRDFMAPRRIRMNAGFGAYTNRLTERVGVASVMVVSETAFLTNDTTTISVYDPLRSNAYILAQADSAHPITNTLLWVDEGGSVGLERTGELRVSSTHTGLVHILIYMFNQ